MTRNVFYEILLLDRVFLNTIPIEVRRNDIKKIKKRKKLQAGPLSQNRSEDRINKCKQECY